MEKPVIRISVRNLVEFILRNGDLESGGTAGDKEAMLKGSRLHRKIQKQMGSHYQAEVSLKKDTEYEDLILRVEGRADGIFTQNEKICIDEIKGVYKNLELLAEPVLVHRAQALCYAWIYLDDHGLEEIDVQMTYAHLDTEMIKRFRETMTREELESWYQRLLDSYHKWLSYQMKWREERNRSMEKLEFPFIYRKGQKEMVAGIYHAISRKEQIFIQAPTGVGKTMSAVFPAVRSIGEGKAETLFYLTARTITRTVAQDAFEILRKNGLLFKTVTITAKEKLCFCEKPECNPETCPYAKGHYDRINDAVYELWTNEQSFDRETILRQAEKWQVCPFEMSLELSVWMDAVICDYNYVFDPHVYLKRFFAEGVQGQYIFLIDEAHNLVDRGREMYSASLVKEDFLALKKIVREYDGKMEHQLDKCSRELLPLKRECEDCRIVGSIEPFVQAVERLYETMEKYLEEHDESPVREDVLDFFFEISHFLLIYDGLDENYVIYTELEEDDSFMVKLFCVNPSVNLKECMQRARSTVLFSATLLPIQYYKSLLGGEKEDFEVYAKSTFNPKKKALYIGSDVTSKYSRRSPKEYYNIAYYLREITRMRYGNYLIFFPSHSFLQSVFEVYEENFLDPETEECIIQEDIMSEEDREQFLSRFEGNRNCELEDMIHMDIEVEEEKSLLGFCVMGGIFSEGIDLKNDSLIGAVIVGTGLPQVCNEREILKSYFDAAGKNGFDYAYRYPGMNKVLQAAGRVIRTSEDVGIVALLDDRFLNGAYQQLFPREWEEYEVVTADRVARRVERFWDEWL